MTTSENRNWPHEATDRVHQLLGQLAAKELECQRLREELRRGELFAALQKVIENIEASGDEWGMLAELRALVERTPT